MQLTVTASGVYCALKMIADPQSVDPAEFGVLAPGGGDRAAGISG